MPISSSSTFRIFFAIAVATILLALSQATGSVHAATFTVTNTNDVGAGSLRQAILDANDMAGADTITFDAAVFPPGTPATISPASDLPTITGDLTIDASGAGVIIDGLAGGGTDGLNFDGGTFSLIGGGGLTIQNFRDGVRVSATGDVTISGTTANNNSEDGFDVGDAALVTISGITANGNGDEGIDIDPTSLPPTDVSISGSTANDNTNEGFQIDTLGNITVIDSTANDNGNEGDDGFRLDSDGDIVVCGVTALRNSEDGIHTQEEDEELANASVTNSVVEGNGGDGIDFDSGLANSSGTFQANGNNISGNGDGMDLDDDDVTVDATGNWWGDPSGPTHPNNPGGSGDNVEDSASNSSGTVVFDPFLTSPSADAGTCPPTPTPTLWGDHNCSGSVTPVDALLTLRFDAGLSTNTGVCPDFGQVVEVLNASLHLWGDVDCSASISPVDALKVLRFDAGLSSSQAEGCPGMGTSVTIVEG